jgi:thiol-disulfide isomerase/thioredoxin
MKWLCLVCILIIVLVSPSRGAEGERAGADEVWAGIVRDAKGLKQPAEWAVTKPTAEALAEFKRSSAALAGKLADRLKDFHKAYPEHPRAMDAWMKEQALRQQASGREEGAKLEASSTAAKKVEAAAPDFKTELTDARRRIQLARAAGAAAEAAELEHSARRLIKAFPKEDAGWVFLMQAARGMGKEKASQFYTEIATKAPHIALRAEAKSQLSMMEANLIRVAAGPNFIAPPADGVLQGKVDRLAFAAVDGRAVSVRALAGKVVLVDFWATWCGPCLRELPQVKAAYDQLHSQGFEIVGVSLDQSQKTLKQFLASNRMEWPQYCDGRVWETVIARDFGVSAVPTMYLVDKKGRLRDVGAQDNLAAKIRFLLAEE